MTRKSAVAASSAHTRPLFARGPVLARAAVLLLVLPFLVACGTKLSPGNPFEGDEEAHITIDVLNLQWTDATLWAHTLGGRTRLGIVGGEERERFTLRLRTSQPISIEIDFMAGGRCRTREIQADPGDVLDLQIDEASCRRSPIQVPGV